MPALSDALDEPGDLTSQHGALAQAVATVIRPELAEINSNMGRIYKRLGMDPM